jgi:hypothetical protein
MKKLTAVVVSLAALGMTATASAATTPAPVSAKMVVKFTHVHANVSQTRCIAVPTAFIGNTRKNVVEAPAHHDYKTGRVDFARVGAKDCVTLTSTVAAPRLYVVFYGVLILNPTDWTHTTGSGRGITHGEG